MIQAIDNVVNAISGVPGFCSFASSGNPSVS